MKKLKKFTIDELEQNFTTIARQDLQYYVGGSGGGSGSSESGTIDYCECLKVKDRTYLSDAEKLDLLDDIAKMAGIRYEVSLTTMASNIYGQSHPNGSWIAINANSELWKTGNLFDLALVMIHEQNHLDTPDDAGTNSSECDANKAVKDSIYFGYGSPYYKDQVDKSVSKYCK